MSGFAVLPSRPDYRPAGADDTSRTEQILPLLVIFGQYEEWMMRLAVVCDGSETHSVTW